jgi:hypothetical protein
MGRLSYAATAADTMRASLQKIFDLHTKGHLVDPLPKELEFSLLPFRSCLDFRLDELRAQREFVGDIYIDIIDDGELNARAFTVEDDEFVGINAGFAVVLPIFYLSVLSHPTACPEIGNAEAERSTGGIEKELLFLSGRARDLPLRINWKQLNQPRDETRMHYAAYLIKLAFDFLLSHEIGHIVRCHITHLAQAHFRIASASAVKMLIEFEHDLSVKECAVRRVLEADADSLAARVQIGAHEHNRPD